MMGTDVHADYGYINMIKKPQETTFAHTFAHRRLRVKRVIRGRSPGHRRRLNLEATSACANQVLHIAPSQHCRLAF